MTGSLRPLHRDLLRSRRQVVTFEVFCARLQDKIHDLQKHADPMLTLYDAEGRELAANDDFYFADPLLSYTIRQDRRLLRPGPRLEVRRRPALGLRPARDQPALRLARLPDGRQPGADGRGRAGRLGQAVQAASDAARCPREPGVAAGAARRRRRQDQPGGVHRQPAAAGARAGAERHARQGDARDAARAASTAGSAARRDLDHFVFAASKGKAIRFEVKARRFGTLLQLEPRLASST